MWTGTGAFGTAAFGIYPFGEPAMVLRIASIGLIVSRTVGLKLGRDRAAGLTAIDRRCRRARDS